MATSQAIDRRRWLVVALVFVAIMLNYVDRQILALLKPTLQAEFGWSDRDYSHMGSAFQFSAALAFLGTGWFIDKVGLRRGFAAGVFAWSVAAMAHAFTTTVTGFVAARAALGAAERWEPRRRSRPPRPTSDQRSAPPSSASATWRPISAR